MAEFENHLAGESSPYLLQHLHNPVDWYPWNEDALEKARREDRPIFLSIGYSACHWCHVMAHESFEDPEIAAYLNDHFVCIKVDREERPDLDSLYMRSVMLMTGSGGWPLTVFLTPGRRPFYGGTYFPKEPRFGIPGFMQVMAGVVKAFNEQRDGLEGSADKVLAAVSESFSGLSPSDFSAAEVARRAVGDILARLDPVEGGFGRGPKFPQPPLLSFLLDEAARSRDRGLMENVLLTLEKMEAGGVRDQVGGGFHRYSVDGTWRVPHYEKMLYDNAQLASLYFRAYTAAGDETFRAVAEQVLADVCSSMGAEGGGFMAALDADSGGGEGLFYLWSPPEIEAVLGRERGRRITRLYGIGEGDGLAERTPHRIMSLREFAGQTGMEVAALKTEVAQCLLELRAARESRPHPGADTKVLTDWNALAALAFLDGFGATGEECLLEKGRDTLSALWRRCWDGATLRHVWDGGKARVEGLLSDYAYLALAEWRAYEMIGDPGHLERVRTLLDGATAIFRDEDTGLFYDSPLSEGGDLLAPVRDGDDGVLPSPVGVLARVLWNWERLTGEVKVRGSLDDLLHAESGQLTASPGTRPALAELAVSRHLPYVDVVVAFDRDTPAARGLLAEARRIAFPGLLVLPLSAERMDGLSAGAFGLFEGRYTQEGCRAFVCVAGACERPVSEREALRHVLDGAFSRVREKASRPQAD